VGTYSREVRFPLFSWLDADTVIHGVKIVRRDLFDAEGLREVPDDVPDTAFVYSLSPDDSAFID